MKLITRLKKFLNAIYPVILILTGLSIFVVCITSIVVLSKFTNFEHAWLYHLAVISLFIATTWWSFYFIYMAVRIIEQPKQNKDSKTRR